MNAKGKLRTQLAGPLLDATRMPFVVKMGGNGDGISRLEFWLIVLVALLYVGHYTGFGLYIRTLVGVGQ